MGFYAEQLLPRFQDKVMDRKGMREIRGRVSSALSGDVVEIGFGTGLNSRHYPAGVATIAAVEPSTLCMRIAQPRIASTSAKIELAGLTGEALDLPSDGFDAALSTWTLCTIPNVEAALAEIRRVLRGVSEVPSRRACGCKRPATSAEKFNGLPAGYEGYDDVGGVLVIVPTATVVDGCRSWIGVTGGYLDLPEGDTGVEGGHDEGGSEHVGVHQPEPGPLADLANPAMGGAPIEALTVMSHRDRAFTPLADSEIDGSRGARHKRNKGWLVALADDSQHSVPSFEGHVLDVGLASVADAQAVEPERHTQRGVGMVEALGGEEDAAELAAVESAPFGGVDRGSANVLGRVGSDPAVDMGEAVAATGC